MAAQDDRAADAEQGHERRDGQDVEQEVGRILDMAAGEQRPALRRPDALAHHRGQHQSDEARGDELGPSRGQGGAEAVAAGQGLDRLQEDQPGGGGDAEGARRDREVAALWLPRRPRSSPRQ